MTSIESHRVVGVANALATRRYRDRLLVLCYHGVEDREAFDAQIRELVLHRRPVRHDEFLRSLRSGVPLAPKSVLVTFDDGDRTVLDVGLPVLRSHGVPATLFVISGLIGTDEPFWWDEVRWLSDRGAATSVVPGRGAELVRGVERGS